jgi:hypothetical protein
MVEKVKNIRRDKKKEVCKFVYLFVWKLKKSQPQAVISVENTQIRRYA